MNLNMPQNFEARRHSAAPLAANQATIYMRGGRPLRIALQPAPVGTGAGCAGHPELQLMRWLRRRAAAEPGFPVRVRSVLLLVRRGGCPECQERLRRFLSRLRLDTKLRLVRTGPKPNNCSCGCAHCQGHQSGPESVLDELLGEVDRHDSEPDDYRKPAPLPPALTPVERAEQERQRKLNKLLQRRLEAQEKARQAQVKTDWQRPSMGAPRALPSVKARPTWGQPVRLKTPWTR